MIKAVIARQYPRMGYLLPPLGITLLLLTWLTSLIIIASHFRG